MRSVRASTNKKRRKQRVSPIRNHVVTPQRISPRIRITPPTPPVMNANGMPLSDEDTLKISDVKSSLRDFIRIPEGKEDASRLSMDQLDFVRSDLSRFHELDFSFCDDEFIWENVIPMRASRQESSLSEDDIPLSVKMSYRRLREYRDMSRDGRMMEKYWSDAMLVGLTKIPSPLLDNKPVCLMLSKECLIRGMRTGCYSDDEREVVEDKIIEGYDSLLRLAIRNRALVLEKDGDLWKETGHILGSDMQAKYIVKEVDSIGTRLVFASADCCAISDGEVICSNCKALERDLRKMAVKRAEFRSGNIARSTNHKCILSTPAVAVPYLKSEAERRKIHLSLDTVLQPLYSASS